MAFKKLFSTNSSALTPPKGFFTKELFPSSVSLRPLKKSLGVSFKINKKQFDMFKQKKYKNYFNLKTNKNIKKTSNKLFGDFDKDKVFNFMDCDPNNPNKQDWDYAAAADQATYVVHMAPQQYLRMTGVQGDPRNVDWLQKYGDRETNKSEPIQRLSGYINDPNKKVAIPYVEGPESRAFGFNQAAREHEGRHRAYAAMLAGHKTIPVRIPIPKKERESVGREFARKKVPYGKSPEWRKDLDTIDRRKHKRRIVEQQFPQWTFDNKGQTVYRNILQKRGMIPTHPYTSAVYQDWDKDRVNNLMDQEPENSMRQ